MNQIKGKGGYDFYTYVLFSNYKDTIRKQFSSNMYLGKECANFSSLDLPRPGGREKHGEVWVRDYILRWLEEKHNIKSTEYSWRKTNKGRKKIDNINQWRMHRRWYSIILLTGGCK